MRNLWTKTKTFYHNKIKNVYTLIMLIFVIILIVAFGISFFFELFKKQSFCATLHWTCPKFMEASVVFEVIKIVAFSTVLVGCIYSNMNKKMLGLTYYEIINSQFYHFKFFSIVHIIATFLCLVFSAAGFSEIANITLGLVLCGFIYHWLVLYYIVLNPNKCADFATAVWQEKAEKPEELYTHLLLLAKSIPTKESPHYSAHIKSFSLLLTRFAKENQCNTEEISAIWNCIFLNQDTVNNKDINGDIFQQLLTFHIAENDVDLQNWILKIVSGYIISELNDIEDGLDREHMDNCYNKLIFKVPLFAIRLSREIPSAQRTICDELIKFINVIMFLYAWVIFQFNIINLPVQIWDVCQNIVEKDNYYFYFGEIVNYKFLNKGKTPSQIQAAIDIAKSQL